MVTANARGIFKLVWHVYFEGREPGACPGFCYDHGIDLNNVGGLLTKADGSPLGKMEEPVFPDNLLIVSCPYCGWRQRSGVLICLRCERPFAYPREC